MQQEQVTSIHVTCRFVFRFPLGLLCAVALGYAWMALLEQPDPQTVANYPFGVLVYATSAVLELSAQPLLVLGQATLFVKLKVRIRL